jgi:pimeloyl-ACP methyl ester carboxylesterase
MSTPTIRLASILCLAASSLVSSSCVIAHPARAVVGSAPTALGARTVAYTSESGRPIHAWFARGRPGEGAVLLLHGVGENRRAMLGRAQFLHDEGFTVLAPDLQAHGESPGEHITFGALESLDAAASVRFLREQAPDERIGVIGVSMGGAAALLGPGPLDVDAFVLESVYPTIRQALADRLAAWLGPFRGLGRALTPVLIDIIGRDIGITEAELQPIDRVGQISAPLLLLFGTADRYTPVGESASLYERAPSPKSYWAVTGAGHQDLYAFAPLEYERRVGGFLMRTLRAPAAVGR